MPGDGRSSTTWCATAPGPPARPSTRQSPARAAERARGRVPLAVARTSRAEPAGPARRLGQPDVVEGTVGDRGHDARRGTWSSTASSCSRTEAEQVGAGGEGRHRGVRYGRRPASRAFMSRASVTTTPSKPSSPRSRSVRIAPAERGRLPSRRRASTHVRGHDRVDAGRRSTAAERHQLARAQRRSSRRRTTGSVQVRVLGGVAVAGEVLGAGGHAGRLQALHERDAVPGDDSAGRRRTQRTPITGLARVAVDVDATAPGPGRRRPRPARRRWMPASASRQPRRRRRRRARRCPGYGLPVAAPAG